MACVHFGVSCTCEFDCTLIDEPSTIPLPDNDGDKGTATTATEG